MEKNKTLEKVVNGFIGYSINRTKTTGAEVIRSVHPPSGQDIIKG